jgi:hypothetical protein
MDVPRIRLTVEIFADSNEEAERLVDSLARAACDIANSSESDAAHISVYEEKGADQ